MTLTAYPFRVINDAAALVAGATITIGAVTLVAGTPANVPAGVALSTFAALNGSTGPLVTYYDAGNGDYSLLYDPTTFGEAYFPIVPSKAASTFTSSNHIVPVCATNVRSNISRALGLVGANIVWDTTTNTAGVLVAATGWVYDTAAHAATNDHSTGLIAKYTLTGTESGGGVTSQTTVIDI